MSELIFTRPDAWNGGFYELALEFGERVADEVIVKTLGAIWEHPDLSGCYHSRSIEPSDQEATTPNATHVQSGLHLYGIATLPNEKRIACGTVIIREDAGVDWLVLYTPIGSLGTAYKVGGFPFDQRSHSMWRKPVDNWFAAIGTTVYRQYRFPLGLIGLETSGDPNSEQVKQSGIPKHRQIGYLWPENGHLHYFPTTDW